MLTLDDYVAAIAKVNTEHPDKAVRVRVSPSEQYRLLSTVFPMNIAWASGLGEYKKFVFLRDTLGASEWVMDQAATEPVFEAISE